MLYMTEKIKEWLREDGWGEGASYWQALPVHPVTAKLYIKSPLRLAGLPWFFHVFEILDPSIKDKWQSYLKWEGHDFQEPTTLTFDFTMSWAAALSGERLALNLLHRASAIATATTQLTVITSPYGIKVLDTRKTSPGLRELEKYAVRCGGGENHRFTQVDCFMIKDNHKELWGLEKAYRFFQNLNQPYKKIIVEIHSLDELNLARQLGLKNFMLDNFSPEKVEAACFDKKPDEFFEISGGINLETVRKFMLKGVDAVSSGRITQFPDPVDISFKFKGI
jgi:nicotinate-nucleotide pyrophosphorylase (carboxylating)